MVKCIVTAISKETHKTVFLQQVKGELGFMDKDYNENYSHAAILDYKEATNLIDDLDGKEAHFDENPEDGAMWIHSWRVIEINLKG